MSEATKAAETAETTATTETPRTRSSEPSIYTRSKNLVFDMFVTIGENPELKAALKKANAKLLEIGEKLFNELPTRHSADPKAALEEVKSEISILWAATVPGTKTPVMQTPDGEEKYRLLLNRKAALEIKLGQRAPKRSKKEQALPRKDPNAPTI